MDYNTATTIRQGAKSGTDAEVLNEKSYRLSERVFSNLSHRPLALRLHARRSASGRQIMTCRALTLTAES